MKKCDKSNKTILIIEDEPKLREIIKDKLTSCGYNVIVAHNGKQSFKHIEKNKPDLIILDIILPDMNGLEILKKTETENENIKFIICTAYDHFKEKPEIKHQNVCDFIVKPFVDLNKLSRTVSQLLG